MILKGTRGFSGIEFIIVVAILGVLAAMAIPHYRDYLSKATCNEVEFDTRQSIETFAAGQVYKPAAGITLRKVSDNPVTVVGRHPSCPWGEFIVIRNGKERWTGIPLETTAPQ